MCFAQSVAELKLTQMFVSKNERETIGCVFRLWNFENWMQTILWQVKKEETGAIER